MLPDDVLLTVFDFCAGKFEKELFQQVWQTLVHVCRRWRSLVFGSPRSLNLKLICTSRTPARDMLDLWPPLPLVILTNPFLYRYAIQNVDNIVAVLKHRNRVCRIHIMDMSSSHFKTVLAAMQEPFPELTSLILWTDEKTMTVLPDMFLGGSAHRLRFLDLVGIPFPGLPNLLLSATHLTYLRLNDIPHSGYFKPEAMTTALSALTSLRDLYLGFYSPLSLPDRATRLQPSLERFVLPVLTEFGFKGVSEYLEDLVVRIDAPLLKNLDITFFNQTLFYTPQLVQFLSRTSALKASEKARVHFGVDSATIKLSSRASDHSVTVKILCENSNRQVSSLERVCTSCLPPLSTLEDLFIHVSPYWRSDWPDNIEVSLWLELLQPFTAVKNLYLSKEVQSCIMPSLQEFGRERTAEVLPTLQSIFLEGLERSGPVQKAIQQYASTRQASRPIAFSRWDGRGKFYEGSDSR